MDNIPRNVVEKLRSLARLDGEYGASPTNEQLLVPICPGEDILERGETDSARSRVCM